MRDVSNTRGTYLSETEDVCLYGEDIEVVVVVEEEDCGDVNTRGGRESHDL